MSTLAPVGTGLGPAQVRYSDHGSAMLRTIKAVKGFASLHEAAEWAAEVAYMALPSAHSVDAGELPPDRPEGGPGQGEAQPPAPLPALLIHRHPIVHIHIDGGPCVFGEDCGR